MSLSENFDFKCYFNYFARMPNPYDEIFNSDDEEKKSSEPLFSKEDLEADDRFDMDGKEPLEEILDTVRQFEYQAEAFSQLLSKTRAIDHQIENKITRLFLVTNDPHDKKSLKGERLYHELQTKKFENIIVPMRSLAQLHLQAVQQFNRDIDKHYYSIDKTDRDVKADKTYATNGINLQRKILADAASDLDILADGLADTERRIKQYINAGGHNNISEAESEMIIRKRTSLTSGQDHQFDYSFFDINLLDKTVLSFGVYMKETTSQYLGKLMMAFEAK